jgi:hypothetical protein
VFQGVASRFQQLIIAPNALGLLVHDYALGKKFPKEMKTRYRSRDYELMVHWKKGALWW